MPASTVAKMDTRYAIVSKILTTNVSTADNLDTLHEIAMSAKNLEDEAEAEANLGEVVAEDEDVALFREREEKVKIMWERQLCLILPRKKIPSSIRQDGPASGTVSSREWITDRLPP